MSGGLSGRGFDLDPVSKWLLGSLASKVREHAVLAFLKRYTRAVINGLLNLSGPMVILTWLVGAFLLAAIWKYVTEGGSSEAGVGVVLIGACVGGALLLSAAGWIVRRRVQVEGRADRATVERTGKDRP